MVRVQNWQRVLVDYLNAQRFTPFQWGVHDCATFAIGAVEALTGQPLDLPELTYRTKREALLFQQTCLPSEVMKNQIAAYPVELICAQSGDILIEQEDYERCYVIYGRKAYAPSPDHSALQVYPLGVLSEPTAIVLRFD